MNLVEARRDRILRIESPEEFEKEMHELVSQLKTSHTGFFHRSARRIPARFAINATFQRCQTSDGPAWVGVRSGWSRCACGSAPACGPPADGQAARKRTLGMCFRHGSFDSAQDKFRRALTGGRRRRTELTQQAGPSPALSLECAGVRVRAVS